MARTRITYVGHGTVLIETKGERILTDPALRGNVWFLIRYKPGISADKLKPVSAVLISHIHHDHLDIASLNSFGKDVRLFVPKGAKVVLERNGFTNVQETEPGDKIGVGKVEIETVPANHLGFRRPFGPLAESVGFVVKGSHNVYFAGDTDTFDGMKKLGKVDAALLPVWGWGPNLGKGHLDPLRAAESLQLIKPRIAIPIHWGTFHPLGIGWFNPSFLLDPPKNFASHVAKLAPKVEVRVVQPGHSTELK
jgi:L-ascorbate metabolism protein UlaG (beta-lactamase superfamily)